MIDEKPVEDKFTEYAESCGCLCLKLVILNKRGWLDRTVFCPNGRLLVIEFKKPGNRRGTSIHQDEYIRSLRELGFEVYVCDDLEEAIGILDRTLNL